MGTFVNNFDYNGDGTTAAFDPFETTFSFGDVDYLGVGARLEDLFLNNPYDDYLDIDGARIILDPVPAENFDYALPGFPSDYCESCWFDADYSDGCKTGRIVLELTHDNMNVVTKEFYYYDSCSISNLRDYFVNEYDFSPGTISYDDLQNFEIFFNMTVIAEYTDRPITNGWKVFMEVFKDEGVFSKRRLLNHETSFYH